MLISTLGNRMVSGWQEIFECARTHAGVCLPSLSSTITEFFLRPNSFCCWEKERHLKANSSAEGRRQVSGLPAVLMVPRVPDSSSPQRLVPLSAFGLCPS